MPNFEVELRSFVSDGKYDQLMKFFRKHGKLVRRDNQVTYSMNDENSIRIQKNDSHSKIWVKLGKSLHDPIHEEIEIKFSKNDFEQMERAMAVMGFTPTIKWFRLRHTFRWKGVNVMLDRTKGYGNIIELEKMCYKEENEEALKTLDKKMAELEIEKTSAEEFERRYAHYKQNWRRLT